MFGYIRPYVPELRVKEHEAYKNVYCGLCHQLGKSFKKWTRLTLSYDFTFLAMVYYINKDNDIVLKKTHCAANPLAKVNIFDNSAGIDYAADAAILMVFYKIQDNISDSSFLSKLGWKFMKLLAKKDKIKAAAKRPELDLIISQMMEKQSRLEEENIDSIDAACEPTACALSQIMGNISDDPQTIRMGYLVGRYIYLCDAMDDLKKDIKANGYNPFALKYVDNSKDETQINNALEKAKEALFMTVGELANLSPKMNFNFFAPIIHNTMELGMYNCVLEIYKKESGATDEPI